MLNQVLALAARLRSHFKSTWKFEDYPVRVRPNVAEGDPVPPNPEYLAQIINWWAFSELGPTPEAAREGLRLKFQEFVDAGNTLPRPGADVPIQWASTSEVDRFENLPYDVAKEAFGIDAMIVTDGTTLYDFAGEDEMPAALNKIYTIYGVDVSDVEDLNLAKVCERITNRQP